MHAASLSFQTSKRGYASDVFFRSWSAAKSYKWSRERKREKEKKRERQEERKQNAEGAQDKKMKGEGVKNERKEEAMREMRTKHRSDPRAFGLFFIL